MNKDQTKGHINEVKGMVKENTGKGFDDNSLEAKDKGQNAAGKVQVNYGDAKEKLKDRS